MGKKVGIYYGQDKDAKRFLSAFLSFKVFEISKMKILDYKFVAGVPKILLKKIKYLHWEYIGNRKNSLGGGFKEGEKIPEWFITKIRTPSGLHEILIYTPKGSKFPRYTAKIINF